MTATDISALYLQAIQARNVSPAQQQALKAAMQQQAKDQHTGWMEHFAEKLNFITHAREHHQQQISQDAARVAQLQQTQNGNLNAQDIQLLTNAFIAAGQAMVDVGAAGPVA